MRKWRCRGSHQPTPSFFHPFLLTPAECRGLYVARTMHPTNQGRRAAPAMRQDPSHLSTMWPRGDIYGIGAPQGETTASDAE
nr:MAG TPA: hypothetical protein [Caudoviricetes sp.]